MGRRARPWKRAGRGWYVWVGSAQVRLAGPEATAKQADAIWRGMQPGRVVVSAHVIVGEIAAAWIGSLDARWRAGELSRSRVAAPKSYLNPFLKAYGELPASSLRSADVEAWLGKQAQWGPTTRAGAANAIRSCFRWAARGGLIDRNPLEGLQGPRPRRREAVLKPGDWPRVSKAIDCPRLLEVLTFLHATGCRPGEAYRIEARHVAPGGRTASLAGKTTKRTGRNAVIILGGSAASIVARLSAVHPTGPIFRQPCGSAWHNQAMHKRMTALRAALGMGPELSAYSFRHLFATDALASGVEIATVSALLGHTTTAMVARTYSHLHDRLDVLSAAAEKVRGTKEPRR
jgi:integrase